MNAAVVSPRRRALISSGVLAMTIFVFTETMLFAGLISAFAIARADAGPAWPPPWQPQLPALQVGGISLLLVLAGVSLVFALRAQLREDLPAARRSLLVTLLAGVSFAALQVVESVALVRSGLTLTSSTMGSFFHLVVGVHILTAAAALVALAGSYRKLLAGEPAAALAPASVLWFFVVGIWPLVYFQVYL